ncbi:AdoMet-dependent rRNA methyltransferase spb1 [Tulasnella sp. 330]|nr:AdoMet-dependent rRNA methyltransferase spb1 [Tulasnella sp. 330]KAG8879939.1 AdoMet-dependent rRNA methyltransferase spb1 [Tulasnella sp. 331]
MAKSGGKKTAKGRLDKYYKLAKEQGYRARSAFKLIQLNRKYEFLNNAKFTIDLCAAPGGWLQVASKYMPVGGLIIGCDLVPIKPIPRVISFPCDITTPKCRQLIRSHAKDWKADVVLHDGAPNVGTAWVQDAYSQSELVLSSLKLAVEFLKKGGTFITKVFRSQDYNNLMWVFNQLFEKVDATKPPSSRNVSAEIFVVCMKYRDPAHIDPKFLDPKHVFKDVEALPPAPIQAGPSASQSVSTAPQTAADDLPTSSKVVLNPNAIKVFKPGKKIRQRDGYADGVTTTLFKAAPASQFIRGNGLQAIDFLGEINKMEFATEEEKGWWALPITTEEIKQNVVDLKVLGKRDFQVLLKWRAKIREEIGIGEKTRAETVKETAEIAEMEPADEETQIQEELERLTVEQLAKRRKERKRMNEKKKKAILQMQLSMIAPTDIGLALNDMALATGQVEDIFDLNDAEGKKASRAGDGGLAAAYDDHDSSDDEEEDNGLAEDVAEMMAWDSDEEDEAILKRREMEMEGMHQAYMQKMMERDAKFKVREARKLDKARSENWNGIGTAPQPDDDSDDDSEADVPAHKRGWENMEVHKAEDDISGSDTDDEMYDNDDDGERVAPRPTKRQKTSGTAPSRERLVTSLPHLEPVRPSGSKMAQVWFGQDIFKDVVDLNNLSDEEVSERGNKENVTPKMKTNDRSKRARAAAVDDENDDDEDGEDFEVVPQDGDDDTAMWNVEDENVDEKKQQQIKKHGLLTPGAITLAQKLVNRQTTKTHLINDGFTRFSLNHKDGLPTWFAEEEQKYYRPNIPVTKEAVRILRAKERALDARPMKKIAEAKARKRMRALRRLEKASKRAEGVAENGEMNEKQKAEAVEKIMRKGYGKAKPKQKTQIIVAGGGTKGLKGRPKGIKGKFKMVDRRGKKDMRGEKRAAKMKQKRKH